MAKRQSKFLVQQKVVVGLFVALLVTAVGYLTFLTLEDAPLGEFVEGEHYLVLENPRRIRGGQVEVMEFFSYGCVHCYNFDPILKDWVEAKGDSIIFVRTPAIANDFWRILGRAYFVIEGRSDFQRQHLEMFRAIHEARRSFPSPEALFDYADEAGMDRETFEADYTSTAVNSAMNRADQMARRMKVASVPTIVIQGKYVVRTTRQIGPKRMLDVMDYLIELEQNSAASTEGDG